MPRLTALGVRTKLTLITLAMILLALFVVAGADILFERNESYRAHVQELSGLMRVVADHTAASVVAGDAALAQENLRVLASRPSTLAACVFERSGDLLARYRRDADVKFCRQFRGQDAVDRFPSYIDIVTGVQAGGARVGEIHIRSDLTELHERLNRILIFTVLVALVTTGMVLWLSRYLHGWVAQPLLDLSERAHRVARDQDFSLRATKVSEDELGVLVDAFNGMLETIERQSRSLMETNVQLEQRVSERTAELRDAQANLLRQERLATLGQLTGSVSHELRNPLGTIQASIDVMRSRIDECPADMERTLDRITRNIHRCENIINELLDYSRGSRPHVREVAVDQWLHEIVESCRVDDFVSVTVDVPKGLRFDMDPERMHRAVVNVIDNAVHALMEAERRPDDRRPTIRINAYAAPTGLTIEIEDNGPGIPDAVRERIFEPLFSTRAFGVGLGLAIVQQILEQHKGAVEVESPKHLGTRVKLWLPEQRT